MPGEVQRLLDGPDLLLLARREDAGRITHGDPADGHGLARRHDRIDLNHSMNPHLSARAHDTAREQGSASSQKAPIAHPRPVQVRVRPCQDVIADDRRMPGPSADQGVFHHHGAVADRTSPSSAVSTAPNKLAPDRRGPGQAAVVWRPAATFCQGLGPRLVGDWFHVFVTLMPHWLHRRRPGLRCWDVDLFPGSAKKWWR